MILVNIKNFTFIIFLFFFILFNNSVKSHPESFADLVQDLIPGVVSIASKTNVGQENQQQMPQFPEGSPFDEFFKEYFDKNQPQSPSRRPMMGLGSGFIIDESGIVVTNNHVM